MIIVPTNFTAADHNAFHYAVRVAKHYNWKIKLVHVAPILVTIPSGVTSNFSENKQNMANFFKKSLLSEAERIFLTQINFEKIVLEGDPTEVLLELASTEKAKMMVVARAPKSNFYRNFFGSVSGSLSKLATCPVLLVPETSAFRGFKQVIFAADLASVRAPFIQEVLDLAQEFGSFVQFLHIGDAFGDDSELKERLYQHVFLNGTPRVGWGYNMLDTDELPEVSIQDWLLENPTDLVILSTQHRRFWDRLGHHSVINGLAKDPLVPMLVLHREDRPYPEFESDKRLQIVEND